MSVKPTAKATPQIPEPAADKPAAELTLRVREQPTNAQVTAARVQARDSSKEQVKAVTASGGRMWDPQHGQWIDGSGRTLATNSAWLKTQVRAGKIKVLE